MKLREDRALRELPRERMLAAARPHEQDLHARTLFGLKGPLAAHDNGMSMQEPGLDRHEWESELETLEPELRDSPAEALPDLADLVERMLNERGFQMEDPLAREGNEPEIIREYRSAREVSDRTERGESVDPGDVAAAINGLRALYDHLLSERTAP
jgi:hypothetical protein